MKRLILLIIASLLLITAAQAATIQGTVYDYSLQVTEAVITIDTTPAQTFVAKDGTYEIIIGPGTYTMQVSKTTAQGLEEKDETTLTITDDGIYTHDFILFQELQEIEEPEISDLPEEKQDGIIWYIILVFLGFALIIVGLYKLTKRKLKKIGEDTLEEEVLMYIKEKKRTTQKDIRKDFPFAEATISLALTALEHKGHIEKVKKGRGNVILFKK